MYSGRGDGGGGGSGGGGSAGSAARRAAAAAAPTLLPQLLGAPLVAGGEALAVTPANRGAFVRAVVAATLAPYAFAASCMRAGLASIVPPRALSLCSWRDLRRLVSGEPVIDIDNLKRNSKYDNSKYFSEEHPSVQMFWRALRELTPEQKSNFIRFAWGRSRLPRGKWPLQQNGTPVRFTIVPRRNVTTGIPLAHTCFFLIELPEYKDYGVCKKMLKLAVTYGAGEAFLIA
jgi:hypothetical protein